MNLTRGSSAVQPWAILLTVLLIIGGCGGGSTNTPPQGPTIVTASLADGTIGSPYSQVIQVSGGTSVTISGTPDRVQSSVAFTVHDGLSLPSIDCNYHVTPERWQ